MTEEKVAPPTGWKLLHSQLPKKALSPLSESVYGVKGLTDVNEGYLIQRLHASGMDWDWRIVGQQYLGSEERTAATSGKKYNVYLASVQGILRIEERQFHGVGAHDNRKLDAAFKGAATVAFKNATKTVGMWLELLLDGRAIDFIYEASAPATKAATATPAPNGPTVQRSATRAATEPPPAPPTAAEAEQYTSYVGHRD